MGSAGEEISNIREKHFHRYVQYAVALLNGYKGYEPFHLHLKKYFSANKKHGSRDRKLITALCYGYFRLGSGVTVSLSIEEKLILGLFLSGNTSSPFLESLKTTWNKNIDSPAREKLEMVKDIFSIDELFPFKNELSNKVNFEKFSTSFLEQPALYLRVRPGNHERVEAKLKAVEIPFKKIGENCLAFLNTQKLTEILKIDEEVLIQDYNSQRTGELIIKYILPVKEKVSLWDCCAASGGKSILAWDILPEPRITVSDSRESILKNLRVRFRKAGIHDYHFFLADLSSPSSHSLLNKKVDFILADVPCTGSGTWGRTPEQMHFTSKKMIEKYASLQRNILSNALPELKDNGYLLYSTCSVFAKENEDNVAFFRDELNLELLESQYLEGYEMEADTLYTAMFRKR